MTDPCWMVTAYKRDHVCGEADEVDAEIMWLIGEGLMEYNPSTGLLNNTQLGELWIAEPAGSA